MKEEAEAPRSHRSFVTASCRPAGGIANVTQLYPSRPTAGFDTGPGNMLLDAWVLKHCGETFDRNATWAKQGCVSDGLLDQLMQHTYFARSPPKSTGRETFNLAWLERKVADFDEQSAGARPLSAVDVQVVLQMRCLPPQPSLSPSACPGEGACRVFCASQSFGAQLCARALSLPLSCHLSLTLSLCAWRRAATLLRQATLCRFTSKTIADHIIGLGHGGCQELLVCGGGCHNPLLMQLLREFLPDTVVSLTTAHVRLSLRPPAFCLHGLGDDGAPRHLHVSSSALAPDGSCGHLTRPAASAGHRCGQHGSAGICLACPSPNHKPDGQPSPSYRRKPRHGAWCRLPPLESASGSVFGVPPRRTAGVWVRGGRESVVAARDGQEPTRSPTANCCSARFLDQNHSRFQDRIGRFIHGRRIHLAR